MTENPSIPTVEEKPVPPRRYEIKHKIRFSYSEPVSLGQFVLRLQPRNSFDQRLVKFSIQSNAKPARHTHCLDLHGNIRHWFWFDQKHSELVLTMQSTVDCLIDNPFDFTIVDPGVVSLPATYEEPVGTASAHYRHRPSPNPIVDAMARQLRYDCESNTVRFLSLLASHLRDQIKHRTRLHGETWSPTQTLERGEGACRDTAQLYIDACRAVGLAARFVSGYAFDAMDEGQRELHAWAEVYLPGAGWRGYDPTVGIAVSNRHVAVAASPTPGFAAPTSGTYSGPKVKSSLDYEINMAVSDGELAVNNGEVFTWPTSG